MAPRLKPISDEKLLAAVPLHEPVLVELEPAATGVDTDTDLKVDKADKGEPPDGASTLEAQLEASKEATRQERDRAIAAEAREREALADRDRLRTAGADTEKELLNTSLANAQAAQASAKAAFKTAFEAGDPDGMAEANAGIARAATDIRNYESAAAVADEDAKIEKDAPRQEPHIDIITAIDRMPNLVPKERDWLKAHPEVLTDPGSIRELDVGYNRAIRAGHKRGTDTYFQYLDEFLGYAKPAKADADAEDHDDHNDERPSIVSAPVTRDSRSSLSGRPTVSTKIMLTPEQRDLARSMGLTDVQYARGKQQLDANKKADPERFVGR